MRRYAITLFLACCLAACAHEERAQAQAASPVATGDAAPGDAGVRLAGALADYPGIAFAVVTRDGVLWSGGLGLADIEAGAPMTPQTPVSVYSVTKPMTAVIALSLAQSGRLTLDQPLGELAPTAPAQLSDRTLRQLLSHTAGVRHYRDGEWLPVSRAACDSTSQGLAPFAGDAPSAAGAYSYSSFGYVLTSHVLEHVSNQSFSALMAAHVFEPAEMRNAALWAPGARRPPNGYERRGQRFAPARAIDNSCKFGGGAVTASAEDLARFGYALASLRLLDQAGLTLMTTPVADDYALGWGVGVFDGGGRYLAHSGSAIGGGASLMIDVDRAIAVAVVGNAEGPSLGDEARALMLAARAN